MKFWGRCTGCECHIDLHRPESPTLYADVTVLPYKIMDEQQRGRGANSKFTTYEKKVWKVCKFAFEHIVPVSLAKIVVNLLCHLRRVIHTEGARQAEFLSFSSA